MLQFQYYILLLLFFRVDHKRTRYTGVLCGLGYDDESEGPALPDHDMEIVFDTSFDVQDLSCVSANFIFD